MFAAAIKKQPPAPAGASPADVRGSSAPSPPSEPQAPAGAPVRQTPSAPSEISPKDLPPPGEQPTYEQMDNLKDNYSQEQLLAAQQKALANGDKQTASILENALAEQGYRAPVDPSDLPQPGQLPHYSQVESLANKYSFDQLAEMAQQARANGDTNTGMALTNAINLKRQQNSWGGSAFTQRVIKANQLRAAQAAQAAQAPPADFSGLDNLAQGGSSSSSSSGSGGLSGAGVAPGAKDPTIAVPRLQPGPPRPNTAAVERPGASPGPASGSGPDTGGQEPGGGDVTLP